MSNRLVASAWYSELHGQELLRGRKSTDQGPRSHKSLDCHGCSECFDPQSQPLYNRINSMTTCAMYQHCCCAHAQVLVKVGAIKAVTSILERIGIQYSIYDGVEPNPTIEQVPSSARLYNTSAACLCAHTSPVSLSYNMSRCLRTPSCKNHVQSCCPLHTFTDLPALNRLHPCSIAALQSVLQSKRHQASECLAGG